VSKLLFGAFETTQFCGVDYLDCFMQLSRRCEPSTFATAPPPSQLTATDKIVVKNVRSPGWVFLIAVRFVIGIMRREGTGTEGRWWKKKNWMKIYFIALDALDAFGANNVSAFYTTA